MGWITLNGTGDQFWCSEEHSSLLVALESHKVNVEYQCRAGYCGACRCRLVAGEVDWLTQPLAAIRSDEILPCCCQARGDIELDL